MGDVGEKIKGKENSREKGRGLMEPKVIILKSVGGVTITLVERTGMTHENCQRR